MFNQYTYKSMGSVNRHMKTLGDTVNDINNSFTTGYKGKKTNFHETINGMKSVTSRDHHNGVSKTTDRELDFAIQGKGFFEVQLPDGTYAYTRDGAFNVGADGQLLSAQGYPVVTTRPDAEYVNKSYDELAQGDASYDVAVNAGNTVIPTGSTVFLDGDGVLKTEDGKLVGKLNVVTFTNPDGLRDIGDNMFIATNTTGDAVDVPIGEMEGQTKLKQGALESSNVSIVKNMSELVQLNTIIKAEMKVIKMLDQMQENLTSTITRNI